MPRKYRTTSKPGHRICTRCNAELPAVPEVFVRDANRALGLGYECRGCHSKRKKGRDRRPERYSNLTPEQKAIHRARQNRYSKTAYGRALYLRKAYQRIDSCDLTTLEVMSMVAAPCVYCGTTDAPRGLDRIDNSLPHVSGNVLPCCAACNFARGARLTVEEMKIVGLAIRQVIEARHG